jgi:hypothetical protein
MTDRAQGSVRTGSRTGEPAAAQETAQGEPLPASATQAIPGTGTQRAVQASGSADSPAAPVPPPAGGGPGAPSPAGAGATSASPVAATSAPATAAPASAPTTAAPASAAGRTEAPAQAGAVRPAKGRGGKPGRGPRRARLQLRHIDTWSALKISLVLSIALFFIWMVAVGVLYVVLSSLGVFGTINELFGQLGSASGSQARGDVVTPGVVFGGAAVIGAINIVLLTALCTVGTFIYNLCSDLVGGLELTLSERD